MRRLVVINPARPPFGAVFLQGDQMLTIQACTVCGNKSIDQELNTGTYWYCDSCDPAKKTLVCKSCHGKGHTTCIICGASLIFHDNREALEMLERGVRF